MKNFWKIALLVAVILLFAGTIILVALGNPFANEILKKTP